jgi:hypothetical protein
MSVNPLPYIYGVEFNGQSIVFKILWISVANINCKNLIYVRKQLTSIAPLGSYRFVNRFFDVCYVLALRKSWFSKNIVVTPRDSASFEAFIEKNGVELRNC